MTIARPFKWDTSTNPDSLKEMSDSELEYLSYYFRLYYASQLSAGQNGSIVYNSGSTHSGTNHPRVGNIYRTIDDSNNPASTMMVAASGNNPEDKRKNMVRNTNPNDYGGSPDDDDASDPGETAFDNSLATRNTYRIWQTTTDTTTDNSAPSNSEYSSKGYLIWNSAGGYLKIENTVANIVDTILKHSNTQMLSGDELGTYRVDAGTPGSDWEAFPEAMFTDTIMTYNSGVTPGTESNTAATTYWLYLKTSHTFTGTTTALVTEPFGWDSGTSSLKQKPITNTSDLVKDILYPIYVGANFPGESSLGIPTYQWNTSNTVDSSYQEVRGTVVDTAYDNSTTRPSYLDGDESSGTYYYDRYGSGSTSATGTYYFIMTIGDSSSFLR